MATAEQRAALVERVARAIASAQRCEVTMQPRQQDLRAADAVLAALAGRLLPPGAVAVRRGDLEAACDELDDSADLAASEGADEYAERVRVKVDRLRAALEAR